MTEAQSGTTTQPMMDSKSIDELKLEIQKLKEELALEKNKGQEVEAVSNFLRLQIHEIVNQVYFLEQHLQNIRKNANSFLERLRELPSD